MRKLFSLALIALAPASVAVAQTLKIHRGQVTVAVPAATAGDMTYTAGTSLTVNGQTYDLSTIDSITVDNSVVAPASVGVVYDGASARVTVSADVAPQLAVTATGADVSVVADATLLQEVSYTLSGASADGSFFMDGEYRAAVTLNGLTLASKRGAAIDIANGKRISVVLPAGTVSTLADAAGGTHKACFFVNGHAEFEGAGRLVLTGNSRHAYASDEYTWLKPGFGSIEVLSAVVDGLHVEQYFRQQDGAVSVRGTQGDGVDVSITKDPTDEFNGQAFLEGGTLTLDVAAEDVKGLKSDSLITITGGTLTATVSGNGSKGLSAGTDLLVQQAAGRSVRIKMTVTGTTYKPGDPLLEAKCRGIRAKGDFTFAGGVIDIVATGASSKAVKIDGNYYYKSGSINCAVDAANL